MLVSIRFILVKTVLKTSENPLGDIKVISLLKRLRNCFKTLILKPFGYLFVTLVTDKAI